MHKLIVVLCIDKSAVFLWIDCVSVVILSIDNYIVILSIDKIARTNSKYSYLGSELWQQFFLYKKTITHAY